MGLETANYISQLIDTNPTGADPASSSDDHHRLVKKVLKQTFPSLAGAVTLTHTQLNAMPGLVADASPAGLVGMFARITPPAGWLKANGAAISRTTYGALYDSIGNMFGAGDGSTTFNLPDLRGEFIRGWDDGRGIDLGRLFSVIQFSQNLAHFHTGITSTEGSHRHEGSGAAQINGAGGAISLMADNLGSFLTAFAGAHGHAFTTSSDGGSEARPRNMPLLMCIKF